MQDDQQAQEYAADPKLRIAWQYRRYIQRQQQAVASSTGSRASPEAPSATLPGIPPIFGGRASRPASTPSAGGGTAQPAKSGNRGGSRSGLGEWCHAFDLSRPMDAALIVQAGQLECAGHRGPDALQSLLQGARAFACQHQHPSAGASATGQPPSPAAAARCYAALTQLLYPEPE